MTRPEKATPRIEWDGTSWLICLPIQDGNVLEAKWEPGVTYLVRIREAGTEPWSFAFETPLTHFSYVDLKPDREYELQIRSKNSAGLGEPSLIRVRTNPTGNTDNVIPFPRK